MKLHSDESIERSVLTLREMTQERNGRGISAVMMLEEQIIALTYEAARYRWLRDNPLWSVGYREKRGKREWRMRQEGEYWGEWWPTHEQAVDHAMALDKAVAAARPAVGAA